MNQSSFYDETERLRALLSYQILDTESDSDLDDLVRLASEICRTPIALISLVDRHRQWFKARVGVDVSEMPSEVDFCVHTIRGNEAFIVPDLSLDPRFQNVSVVCAEPHVRFYAGVPLINPDGHALGTLCVIDTTPRELEPHQVKALEVLARQVVSHLELHRQNLELALAAEALRRKEEDVKRSEGRWRAVMEASLDSILTIDHEGKIVEFNPKSEEVFGYRREEALGKEAVFLFPPELRESHREGFRRYLSTGQNVFPNHRLELSAARADGEIFPVELTLMQIEGEEPPLFTVYFRDISERVRTDEALRRSEVYFRTLIENATDIITILNADGTIHYESPSVYRVLGYRPEELVGQQVFDHVHPDDLALVLERFTRLTETGESRESVTFRFRHRDGSWRALEAIGSLMLGDGGAPQIVVNSRDVTERIQAAERMVQAKEEAERANAAKSEFLSRMSHELRTPMNAILGFAQLLEMGDLDEFQKEGVEQILGAGGHLLRLINEVLDIARIEADRLTLSLEPVCLRDVVKETVALVSPLAAQRGIPLLIDEECDGCAMADHHRLKQILLNLLSNAIKYNHPGGSVSLSCQTESEEHLVLTVTDTGPGIPPEKLEKLFSPFERLDADQTGEEGTGLGLVLSLRLAEAMGGTIRVESVVGKGSAFHIEIPRATEPAVQAEGEIVGDEFIAVSGIKTSTVLYIEDNPSNLRLVERILANQSEIRLLEARRGIDGVELACRACPDLILLDLNLPDLSGHEALQLLKGDPRTAGIPVVVISADATAGQVERLLRAGSAGYLTKPLNVRDFMRTIEDLLREPCLT